MTDEQRTQLQAALESKNIQIQDVVLVFELILQADLGPSKAYENLEKIVQGLLAELHAAQVKLIRAGISLWE